MTIIVTAVPDLSETTLFSYVKQIPGLPDCLLRLLNLCRKFINFRACYGQPEFPFCKGKHYGP